MSGMKNRQLPKLTPENFADTPKDSYIWKMQLYMSNHSVKKGDRVYKIYDEVGIGD